MDAIQEGFSKQWVRWSVAGIVLCFGTVVLAKPPITITRGNEGQEQINLEVIQIDGSYKADATYEFEALNIEGNLGGGHAGSGKSLCGDCKDGVDTPKKNSPLPNPNAPAAQKSQLQLELEAKQAAEDAEILYVKKVRQDDEPLENESMVVKWLTDKLKNKLLPTGPWGTVLDSLKPTVGGLSEFDKAKDKEEMTRLRKEIDAEERQLRKDREENAKLYEQNMKALEPKFSPEELARAIASLPELNNMQNAIIARAKLRSEDYGFVVQQVLSRTRFDADIRMPEATYKKVAKELWRITPSNVCVVPTTPSTICVLYGIRKGPALYMPERSKRILRVWPWKDYTSTRGEYLPP